VYRLVERLACAPLGLFQHRTFREVARVSDARIGHRFDADGDDQLGAQDCGLDDADPSDADALGARGEPRVPDGATGARTEGLGLGAGPEDEIVGRS
jgi:hypothetical protein